MMLNQAAARWATIFLLSGTFWVAGSNLTFAQGGLRVRDEPVFTLRTPAASARLRLVQQRLEEILLQASSSQPQVGLEIPAPPSPDPLVAPLPAHTLLDGQLPLTVTPADAEVHAPSQPADLARVWAERLQKALDSAESQQRLFFALDLPEQLVWQGRLYRRGEQPIADNGQLVTDGTRIGNHVAYWEIPFGEDPLGFSYQPVLPDPPPERLFLLNRLRQFVPYELRP